jgi:hypothetical protein
MPWGLEVGVSTVWRYVREAVDLFATTADDLDAGMKGSAEAGQMRLE